MTKTWLKKETLKRANERTSERTSDQTKEIENDNGGGNGNQEFYAQSTLTHSHSHSQMCTGRAMDRVIFLVFTFIRGWNGRVASLDGTQLTLTVYISSQQLYRSLVDFAFVTIHFWFFLSNLFFIFIKWKIDREAHTSAQFYSNFSSKHVEKFERIFICIVSESAEWAKQWGHRRQPLIRPTNGNDIGGDGKTRRHADTQTHESKGFGIEEACARS